MNSFTKRNRMAISNLIQIILLIYTRSIIIAGDIFIHSRTKNEVICSLNKDFQLFKDRISSEKNLMSKFKK
jgi:hypothetical protein